MSNTIPKIFLFDMDGVLIRAGGYGAGADETLRYFFNKLHLPVLADDRSVRIWFEAAGVSSEWDMVPIALAVIIDRALHHCPPTQELESLEQIYHHLEGKNLEIGDLNFDQIVRDLRPHFRRKPAPADSILDLIMSDEGEIFFSNIKKHPKLAGQVLRHSRDEGNSMVNRVFQNFVLGDQIFEKVYGRPAEFKSESVLLKFDEPLLSEKWRQKIFELRKQSRLFPVAYTARPSLAPKEQQSNQAGYSPEAEMALSLLGFETVPLIGYGRLLYTANIFQADADAMIKPAPFQAVAAVKAAWCGNEWEALQWAFGVFNQFGLKPQTLDGLPKAFEMHVFEDTAGGITAGRKAAEVLSGLGLDIKFFGWGIATGEAKIKTLQAVGVPIFEDVNLAIGQALE